MSDSPQPTATASAAVVPMHAVAPVDTTSTSSDPLALVESQKLAADIEKAHSHHDHPEPTLVSSLMHTVKMSYLNVMLAFVPLGIIGGILKWNSVLVFWLNFFAIVPLASMLGFATEELALRTNESIGGLLNATFGNAVEVIVSVLALKAGLVTVVQSSLIGSILSNVLLVLGMCFLLGGYKYDMQTFNTTAANTSSSLMAVSVMSLMMPTAYVLSLKSENISDAKIEDGVVTLSRMTAILLLFVYAGYLFFQLRTHKRLYADEVNEGDDDPETPVLTAVFSVGLLLVSTVMVAVNSEFLVDNLQEMAEAWHLPQTFVGLILLPIVGNAAEHLSACTFALKNKMNLAIGIAVGSSIQIALLVLPLMVIVGWIIQVNMTLYFGTFDTVVLFIAVLLTNYLIVDGQSNWLEGVMLLVAYLIIAIAFFLVPSDAHE